MLGHTEQVWGLASHPTLPQFATAGHDRLLQMWDSLSHTVVWSKDIAVRFSGDSICHSSTVIYFYSYLIVTKSLIMQEQAQSVCFSPDGSIMVVGCVSGKWLAIDSGTRELYSHHSDGSEPLQVK